MKIKITQTEGNWQFGTIGGIKFYVQVFDEPSGYGIKDGRISRLWIDGMANYDRGWDKDTLNAQSQATGQRTPRTLR